MPTLKKLAVAIGLTNNRVDVSTSRTGLTCIGRWNEHNRYASNICFVPDKQAQLVKRPVICSTSFRFAAWLLIERLSNICQILKNQCCTQLSCILNNPLRYVVIQPLVIPLFLARKPSQQSSRTVSAFALNIGSNFAVTIAIASASGLLLFFVGWGMIHLSFKVDPFAAPVVL